MKRLIVLSTALLVGCLNPHEATTVEQQTIENPKAPARIFHLKRRDNFGESLFEVVEIDGCEYLLNTTSDDADLTHKGNCKFCLERSDDR